MSDSTNTSGVREAAINYLTEQYAEIFWVSREDAIIIENNLQNMDDEGLKRELEILNGYYYNVSQEYSSGFREINKIAEEKERENTETVTFNF